MNEMSRACDVLDFDGHTTLVGSDDIGYIKHVFLSGFENIKFSTDDKVIHFISLMGNNMISIALVIGEENTCFTSNRYNFIENNQIEEGTLLNSTNDSVDPFDYHLVKCDKLLSGQWSETKFALFTRMKRMFIYGELTED